MNLKFLNLVFLISCSSFLYGQSDYFQQEVNTLIEVTLDDDRNELIANEKIQYINHSPDTLSEIFIHLWANAYSSLDTDLSSQLLQNEELEFQFSDETERGYISELKFTSNGSPISYSLYNNRPDVLVLELNAGLLPNDSILLETPFLVKIPKAKFSRFGYLDRSYHITQWFPKPAVYDKDGWHPMSYLSQGEFYSEFGSYDVKITLPSSYVVGATGDLIDNFEENRFLKMKNRMTIAYFNNDSIDYQDSSTYISPIKTLHFHQDSVHDFAWFASKDYYVLSREIELPRSKKKIKSNALFTSDQMKIWKNSLDYVQDAVLFYSNHVGEYPYNQITIVDGVDASGVDMEYPNIALIGRKTSRGGFEHVVVHEVGHNWFYGVLGSNERSSAWVDEGMNSFMENRYTESKYPNRKLHFGFRSARAKKLGFLQYGSRGAYDLGYLLSARQNQDQPLSQDARLFSKRNYVNMVYGKSAIGFDYLLAYLGDTLFDTCMKEYFNNWKFKHPKPSDIQQVFEKISKKNLTWFFDDYVKTTKKIDYAIVGITKFSDSVKLKIKNKGKINAPFSISGIKKGEEFTKWYEGMDNNRIIHLPSDVDYFVIDKKHDLPEINRKDNWIRTSGIFKKHEPIKIQLFSSLEKENETNLYWFPALGWNFQNKIMMGFGLHNKSILSKKMEWIIIPMYSISTKSLVGLSSFELKTYKVPKFRKITFRYSAKAFNSTQSNATSTSNNNYIYWSKHEISFKGLVKRKIFSSASHIGEIKLATIQRTTTNDIYTASFNYKIDNFQVLKPKSINLNLITISSQAYGDYMGVSLEAKYRKNYNLKLKGIEFRAFAGTTIVSSETNSTFSNWSLSSRLGYYDYLYDHHLLARKANKEDILSQQITASQGQFKLSTSEPLGNNNQWIFSLNNKIEIPKIPIGVYQDFGVYPKINNDIDIMYNLGLYISLKKSIIEIFFPVIHSNNINNIIKNDNRIYFQQISFLINFNKLTIRNIVNGFIG